MEYIFTAGTPGTAGKHTGIVLYIPLLYCIVQLDTIESKLKRDFQILNAAVIYPISGYGQYLKYQV